jgi:hypothetical protein
MRSPPKRKVAASAVSESVRLTAQQTWTEAAIVECYEMLVHLSRVLSYRSTLPLSWQRQDTAGVVEVRRHRLTSAARTLFEHPASTSHVARRSGTSRCLLSLILSLRGGLLPRLLPPFQDHARAASRRGVSARVCAAKNRPRAPAEAYYR